MGNLAEVAEREYCHFGFFVVTGDFCRRHYKDCLTDLTIYTPGVDLFRRRKSYPVLNSGDGRISL